MYADVLIQYGIKSLDKTFTYSIPEFLQGSIAKGMKVRIPFANQNINGFVVNIHNNKPDIEVKEIKSVVTSSLKLNDELLELGKYIKETTLCSLISAYQTMLPSSMKVNKSKESYDLYDTYIKLNKSIPEIEEYIFNNKRSKKQIEILEMLTENRILKKELPSSAVKTLLDKGLVIEEKEHIFRIDKSYVSINKRTLTKEQQQVCDEILSQKNTNSTFLLHGVTGSGKTEVYMEVIDNIIKEGKSAIMLVPEITLTTQIVKRFYNHFGNDVAIFHSNLSEGEKYDEYRKISEGLVHVVVGTRSAIFTPMKSIGVIIIDEEHTTSYKQENNPRYHALDMALWRSKYHNCPVILGSATPSLESFARAKKGVYKLLTLDKRIGDSTLPDIKIIDMASEYKKRNMILSDELQMEIMKRLDNHEQVMLLLNRRGFSTIATCQSCGYTHKCPHCDITLTYHKTSNHLRCHYCGYTLIYSSTCPECNEDAVRDFGIGTQKVEEYIKSLYPSYKIIRMDIDTTSRKGSHEKIIEDIENNNIDIIIGTQMISKGLDFPNITLVGIINADESLNIPDFRSGESTFSLLSQTAGRAGRNIKKGLVIIQTFNPDNKTLLNVQNNDYIANYNYEMEIRKKLKYPPYYFLISIKVTGYDYQYVSVEANKVASYIRSKIDPTTICLGPTTAQMFKINNLYRFQIIIKYRFDNNLFDILKYIDDQYIMNKKANIEIDINPSRI